MKTFIMGSISECRICGDDGQYNIFTDEICLEKAKVKIYIAMNNFIFEKVRVERMS